MVSSAFATLLVVSDNHPMLRATLPGYYKSRPSLTYGDRRSCAECSTKLSQYNPDDVCAACDMKRRKERDRILAESPPTPDLIERVEPTLEDAFTRFDPTPDVKSYHEEAEVTAMTATLPPLRPAPRRIPAGATILNKNKWKSKAYPDGCPDCPEGERLLKTHHSRGYCSGHYKQRRASGDIVTDKDAGPKKENPVVKTETIKRDDLDAHTQARREAVTCCGDPFECTEDSCPTADSFTITTLGFDPAPVDPEISAISAVQDALHGFDPATIRRILGWAYDRFDIGSLDRKGDA